MSGRWVDERPGCRGLGTIKTIESDILSSPYIWNTRVVIPDFCSTEEFGCGGGNTHYLICIVSLWILVCIRFFVQSLPTWRCFALEKHIGACSYGELNSISLFVGEETCILFPCKQKGQTSLRIGPYPRMFSVCEADCAQVLVRLAVYTITLCTYVTFLYESTGFLVFIHMLHSFLKVQAC